jgi:hypothetical protein
LKDIGIANQVQEQVEANRDNTKTVAQFQLEQAQTIEALTTRLALLEASKPQAYGAQVPPTIITPPPAGQRHKPNDNHFASHHGGTDQDKPGVNRWQ